MARIVLGIGTSHTPMLLVDAADLPRYEENDRRLKLLDPDGKPVTFDALLATNGERHREAVTAQALAERHAAARAAIDGLTEEITAAKPDVLVIIGDDQQEMLKGDTIPPVVIYDGPTIRSARPSHPKNRPEWVLRGSDRYYPDEPADYPVAQDLGRHIAGYLRHQLFEARTGHGEEAMGHAFAFVHSQLLRGQTIPVVPILLNALYPPNQPSPMRCFGIGSAIADAIATFPGAGRVGIVASGGLSHFVVDEEMDRAIVQALQAGDGDALMRLPAHRLNSGSGEIRNWICAAGALQASRLARIEYFPGYRTSAGTGVGLCFAVWR